VECAEDKQIAVAGDDQLRFGAERSSEYVVVVWIAADGSAERLRLDEHGQVLVILDEGCG